MSGRVVTKGAHGVQTVGGTKPPVVLTHHTPELTLSWGESLVATQIACQRQIRNLREGNPPSHGAHPDAMWSGPIEAVGAEMVVAKFMGVYYEGAILKADRHGDVLHHEVRSTSDLDKHLLLHKTDLKEKKPSSAAIFVTGALPTFTIQGWIRLTDAIDDRYWASWLPRPCFAVPPQELRPIHTLKEEGPA